MSCCSLITITFGALAAMAFLIAANVGTIKNHAAKSSIFLLELSLENLSIDSLSSDLAQYSLREIGLAEAYIFGMYGYCKGTTTSDTTNVDVVWQDIHFSADNCTDPSIDYSFNPVQFFVDQINENNALGLAIDQSELELPGGLNDYIEIAANLSRVIYITSIIAICLQAVSLLFEWFCCFVGGGAVTSTFQFLACVSAFISSGAATGEFVYIRNEFNKYFGTFGIKAMLSRNFLVLTWLGTGFTLFTFIFMIVNNCCYTRTTMPRIHERVVI